MFVGYITGKLAKRRARRIQQSRKHQERLKQKKLAETQQELELLSTQVLMEHIRECQEGEFEHQGQQEDANIWLRSFFNPQAGERETHIRVKSPKLKETLLVIFSQRAICKHQEWRLEYRPA